MTATTTAAAAVGTDESSLLSMVSLLADACRMAHVKGRWVYTDSGYEHLYRVVAPTLPGNGDYSMAGRLTPLSFGVAFDLSGDVRVNIFAKLSKSGTNL